MMPGVPCLYKQATFNTRKEPLKDGMQSQNSVTGFYVIWNLYTHTQTYMHTYINAYIHLRGQQSFTIFKLSLISKVAFLANH